MQTTDIITEFFGKIRTDPRIGTSHIALYVSLVSLRENSEVTEPLDLFSWQVMPVAKISSCATYVKLIGELNAYCYLRYQPSYYKKKPSSIWLNVTCETM
jgi:hypothetical protein